jgi:hypothetical protein
MPKGLPADFYLVRIVESYLNIIVVRKGQGLVREAHKALVEATKGCCINRGKSGSRVKSTKLKNKFCRLAQ